MAKWVCNVCGYVAEGEAAPEEMGYLKFVIEKEVFETALK